jgi:hypothetical protein
VKTAKQTIMRMVEQEIAEEATGIAERASSAPLYADGGDTVSVARARKLFRQGVPIHDPNAGSGSFRSVLSRLGFNDVEVEEWTSSAGDWVFRVRSGLVFQTNRYPYHGFMYTFNRE